MEKRRAEAIKKLVKQNHSTREALENWMTSNKVTKLYLPAADEGGARCVSIRKTTSQRAINENAVRNALDDLFHQVNPQEEISLKEPKVITDSVYQAVHHRCVQKGQTISVTQCRRAQKNTKEFDPKVLANLSKYADMYDETQKQIKDKRKHYAEARDYYKEKIEENEQPVRQHLLAQKESMGRPVQKVTLTSDDQESEDVSLLFQQRKTNRCTKRLGLRIFRQMIENILKRRTKQLEQRGIYRVRWTDFLPVLIEDLVHDINQFHQQNREQVVHEHVSMRACRRGKAGGLNSHSDKKKELEIPRKSSGIVREKTKKRKSSKKRRAHSPRK